MYKLSLLLFSTILMLAITVQGKIAVTLEKEILLPDSISNFKNPKFIKNTEDGCYDLYIEDKSYKNDFVATISLKDGSIKDFYKIGDYGSTSILNYGLLDNDNLIDFVEVFYKPEEEYKNIYAIFNFSEHPSYNNDTIVVFNTKAEDIEKIEEISIFNDLISNQLILYGKYSYRVDDPIIPPFYYLKYKYFRYDIFNQTFIETSRIRKTATDYFPLYNDTVINSIAIENIFRSGCAPGEICHNYGNYKISIFNGTSLTSEFLYNCGFGFYSEHRTTYFAYLIDDFLSSSDRYEIVLAVYNSAHDYATPGDNGCHYVSWELVCYDLSFSNSLVKLWDIKSTIIYHLFYDERFNNNFFSANNDRISMHNSKNGEMIDHSDNFDPRSTEIMEFHAITIDGPQYIIYHLGNKLQFYSLDISTSTENESTTSLPNSFTLAQNYPNPFNPSTTIEYTIPSKGMVNISVYNIMGQKVTTLSNEIMSAGIHTVEWDGNDHNGNATASGVYLIKASYGDQTKTVKSLLMK